MSIVNVENVAAQIIDDQAVSILAEVDNRYTMAATLLPANNASVSAAVADEQQMSVGMGVL